MNYRAAAVLVTTVLVIGGLAACTSTTTGSPTPATGSGSPAPEVTAPKVAHPLDAAPFLAKPCDALTPNDTAALGLAGAKAEDNKGGVAPGCSFFVNLIGVNVAWQTLDPQGLTALYQLRSSRAYWIPMTIGGYPAVEADGDDARASGSCAVNVGVNDHLFFFASAEGANGAEQACSRAKGAAAAVVKNLAAAQGGG
jgi:hypothetical protein